VLRDFPENVDDDSLLMPMNRALNSEVLACWNGAFMNLDEVRVPATDRAYLFGDGIYEVLRVYSGSPFLWDGHWKRLRRSCQEIELSCDLDRLEGRVRSTLEKSGVRDGMIYIQLSRMGSSREHTFPAPPQPANELVFCKPYPTPPGQHEREVGAKAILRQDVRWMRRDIKSVNLLANCMAKEEAKRQGAYETIFFGPDGNITEATASNVFVVSRGRLLTAPEGPHLLSGITRMHVLELAQRLQIECREVFFPQEVLLRADEVFITSTTSEILPIVQVGDQPIGSGTVGIFTRRLQGSFRE
jgi:D-alanine transaminase